MQCDSIGTTPAANYIWFGGGGEARGVRRRLLFNWNLALVFYSPNFLLPSLAANWRTRCRRTVHIVKETSLIRVQSTVSSNSAPCVVGTKLPSLFLWLVYCTYCWVKMVSDRGMYFAGSNLNAQMGKQRKRRIFMFATICSLAPVDGHVVSLNTIPVLLLEKEKFEVEWYFQGLWGDSWENWMNEFLFKINLLIEQHSFHVETVIWRAGSRNCC